ncbi:hypothetical protein PC1_2076 [Pectobacterium carotovorum subsp. carotovorum PC1]|uniref:Uncharacterized protein n=1 Tax=Pectobacterium carotovorum subsp. carotovorum (strain PC1) TaxID=561230 RepID=C6DHU3_PECCP|nr:hypothetical protein PC1_2076 [Pectobacterium carotovorum subsp. carotovorum PC1]
MDMILLNFFYFSLLGVGIYKIYSFLKCFFIAVHAHYWGD